MVFAVDERFLLFVFEITELSSLNNESEKVGKSKLRYFLRDFEVKNC